MFNVILADCDKSCLNMLAHNFRWKELGFNIAAVFNCCLEALDYITHNKVDLVITEIEMPDLNGVDFLKQVRCKDLCPCIVGLSHKKSYYYARQGIIYGAFDYILKPVQKQELLETIKRAAEFLKNKNEADSHKDLTCNHTGNCTNIWGGYEYYLSHPNNIVRKVCEYVTSNSDENITLKTISEKFYISTNYFSYLFKEQTGENFQSFLSRVKIEKAKYLLSETNYKVYEVCHMLGYNEPAYFSRLFKKFTGKKPTEYRKNYEKIKIQ